MTSGRAGAKGQANGSRAEGATSGGCLTALCDETLDSERTGTAGTMLKLGTLLKAGTVIGQDMVLNTNSTGAGATEIDISAGAVLTSDLFVDDDTTMSEDMLLKENSVIKSDSILAVNTANAGTVGLNDTETYNLSELSVLNSESAQRAISIADSALEGVDEIRASLGSVQNQLAATISNLSITKTNIQASESSIRDVDFAEESMIFSKMQLLSQTSSYALAQANASAQNVMNLLQ